MKFGIGKSQRYLLEYDPTKEAVALCQVERLLTRFSGAEPSFDLGGNAVNEICALIVKDNQRRAILNSLVESRSDSRFFLRCQIRNTYRRLLKVIHGKVLLLSPPFIEDLVEVKAMLT